MEQVFISLIKASREVKVNYLDIWAGGIAFVIMIVLLALLLQVKGVVSRK